MYVRNTGHDNEGGGGRGGSGAMGNNLNRGELSVRDIVNATLPQMALPCYLILITLVGTRVCG